MNRRMWVAALGLAAMASFALAADKPDFSGTWKVNNAKSDFGQMSPPEKMERVIEHKDPDIKIKTTQSTRQGERTSETAYKLDGTEQKFETPLGVAIYTPKWDGNEILVITNQKRKFQDQEVEIKGEERWSLSEDGKTMTVQSKMVAPMGEMAMKAVFERQ